VKWNTDGYRVVSQTDFTAQLVKPKQFSILWFVLWLLLAVGPALLYVLYYFAVKKDRAIFIEIDEAGWVRETKS
jgi:hypothetical protein